MTATIAATGVKLAYLALTRAFWTLERDSLPINWWIS